LPYKKKNNSFASIAQNIADSIFAFLHFGTLADLYDITARERHSVYEINSVQLEG
jgi:hypothetical protein